jgi:phosphoglycerate dehydrogenase-like enzyme
MKPTVILTEHLDAIAADWLAERCEVLWHRHDQPGIERVLAEADGLVVRTYTNVNSALLAQAPKLKVVGRAGVGLDNIDVPACRSHGVEVVYTPDANTQAVVEYVMGLMLDEVRPRTVLPPGSDAEVFHGLRKTEVGRQLDELTLGIVGLGRIGKRLGRAASAIGMNVLGCDVLSPEALNMPADVPIRRVTHDELYQQADIVTLHADGRTDNRHMISTDQLNLMKPQAMLINAARGMLVNEAALAAWLKRCPKARALLDVHDPEPPHPAPEDALSGLGNATRYPHLASRTHSAMLNMSWVVRDVAGVLEGKPPTYPAP